jgi:KRAB domain-containing zinc finger protein
MLARHSRYKHKKKLEKIVRSKDEKEFCCDYCDKRFSKKHHIKLHMASHSTENRPYQCNKCFLTFEDEDLLVDHCKTHDETALIVTTIYQDNGNVCCQFCPEQLENYKMYVKHLKEHKSLIKGAIFECGPCKKRFTTKLQFRDHGRVHDSRKFVCEICQRAFLFMSQLKVHYIVHESKKAKQELQHKPRMCRKCNEAFENVKLYKAHVRRVHANDSKSKKNESVLCSICGNKYMSKLYLKQHLLTHNDQYNFPCEQCPSKFKTYAQLYKHKTLHGEKRYACEKCGETKVFPSTSGGRCYQRPREGGREHLG